MSDKAPASQAPASQAPASQATMTPEAANAIGGWRMYQTLLAYRKQRSEQLDRMEAAYVAKIRDERRQHERERQDLQRQISDLRQQEDVAVKDAADAFNDLQQMQHAAANALRGQRATAAQLAQVTQQLAYEQHARQKAEHNFGLAEQARAEAVDYVNQKNKTISRMSREIAGMISEECAQRANYKSRAANYERIRHELFTTVYMTGSAEFMPRTLLPALAGMLDDVGPKGLAARAQHQRLIATEDELRQQRADAVRRCGIKNAAEYDIGLLSFSPDLDMFGSVDDTDLLGDRALREAYHTLDDIVADRRYPSPERWWHEHSPPRRDQRRDQRDERQPKRRRIDDDDGSKKQPPSQQPPSQQPPSQQPPSQQPPRVSLHYNALQSLMSLRAVLPASHAPRESPPRFRTCN